MPEVRGQQIVARLVAADRKATVTAGPKVSGWRSPSTEECSAASLIGSCSGGRQTRKTTTTPPFLSHLHCSVGRQRQTHDSQPAAGKRRFTYYLLSAFGLASISSQFCCNADLSIFRWELELQPWAVRAAGRPSPVRHFNSSLVTAC